MAIDFAELSIKVKSDDLGRLTVELDKVTAAGTRAQASTDGLGESHKKTSGHITDSSRAMTLMQGKAIEMNDAINKGNTHLGFWDSILQKATQHSGEHTVGIGKLERGFEEMAAKALGANRMVGLLGATTLKFGIGTIETVGVLGGIALITYAWEKLTESVRAADKAQNEAAASALSALRAHVGGPGGSFADQMTGAIGKSQDIAEQIKIKSSFWESLKSGDFLSFNLNPSDRQDQVRNLGIDKGQYDLAVKWLKLQKDLADAKQYANSVTTPYDRAISRGTSIDGFYSQALAAEGKLSELAKSGTFEVRDAAIQALGALDKIVTQHKLINMGLGTAPHQISGIESNAYIAAARRETGDLSAGIASATVHGADISSFDAQIRGLEGTLDKARATDLADITALAAVRDEILLLRDATRMAGAKTPGEQENIADAIRSRRGFTSMAGPLDNATAQRAYGDNLAQREAALKLPAAFDAVREAALRAAEGLRGAKQNLALTLGSFGISQDDEHHWHFNAGNIRQGAETGAIEGATAALQNFTPQGLAYSAVTAGINYIASGFMDLAGSLLGGGQAAREAKLQFEAMKDSLNQAIAAFKHDDLAASLAGVLSQQDALIKQAYDTYGTASYIILHGTADLTKALDQIGKGAGLSTEIIKRQAQYATEDLAVRNMRATGNSADADLLAFRESQQREMQKAIDANKDATYLSYLATVQNNELLAYQNGLLSSALRNAPTGFYGSEAYAGAYATPRGPAGYPSDSGSSSTGLPRISGRTSGTTTIILQVDGKVLTRTVVNNIDQHGAATLGAGSPRSAALDRYPS